MIRWAFLLPASFRAAPPALFVMCRLTCLNVGTLNFLKVERVPLQGSERLLTTVVQEMSVWEPAGVLTTLHLVHVAFIVSTDFSDQFKVKVMTFAIGSCDIPGTSHGGSDLCFGAYITELQNRRGHICDLRKLNLGQALSSRNFELLSLLCRTPDRIIEERQWQSL